MISSSCLASVLPSVEMFTQSSLPIKEEEEEREGQQSGGEGVGVVVVVPPSLLNIDLSIDSPHSSQTAFSLPLSYSFLTHSSSLFLSFFHSL